MYYKGQSYFYAGKTEAGKKIWRELIQSDPDMSLAVNALKNIKTAEALKEAANKEFKGGKKDLALKHYYEIIDLDPFNRKYNSLILGNICSTYISLKKYKDALKAINKAIEYDENYAKAYYKRGEVNKELKDWAGFERDIKRAQN